MAQKSLPKFGRASFWSILPWAALFWPASLFTVFGQEIPPAILGSIALFVLASLRRFPVEILVAATLGIGSIMLSFTHSPNPSTVFALGLVILPIAAFHYGASVERVDVFVFKFGRALAIVGAVCGVLLILSTFAIGISPRSFGYNSVFANGYIPPKLYAADGLNTTATVLCFIFMIAATSLVVHPPSRLRSVVLWCGNLMLLFYVIALSSRQVWIGLFVFALLAFVKRKRYAIIFTVLLGVLSQVDFSSLLNGLDTSSAAHRFLKIVSFFTNPNGGDINSLSSNRTYIYEYSLELIGQHPFFGLGFDSSAFKLAMNGNSSSHNYFITLFVKGGLFFGLYFLFLLGRIVSRTMGSFAKENGNAVWGPFVISALIQSLFWDVLLLPISATAFFLVGGIVYNRSLRPKRVY